MPIYEYQCQSCNYGFEKLQKMSDDPLTECPECRQHSLKKKISAAGFRLSGGGWYETDFKKGDKKKNLAGEQQSSAADKTDSKKPAEGSTSTPKTTESKPAKPSVSNQ